MSLADSPWPEIAPRNPVIIPLGSTEQHGPHLPLDTDTVIAVAVARDLAPLIGGSVGPAIPVGASGEHQDFPGTISIGTAALTDVIVELVRSLQTWAGRVVLVNGHGGNVEAVLHAVALLRGEGRDVAWVPCARSVAEQGSDAHAGRVETSLMLHLDPSRVKIAQARPGNTAPLAELLPALRRSGVGAVSVNGVLGDPTGASDQEGARILQEIVSSAYHRLESEVRVP